MSEVIFVEELTKAYKGDQGSELCDETASGDYHG